ncbi:dehydrogenase [Bacillus toyonensis]|uniref:SagB/ThcOx family dehydrogenase n=1 Tax=Bacillus toyonensis TaxID=155322 RepID=UPI000BF833D4|nr:SagB/ThcOx family dehydrogenase [Bacillus toyonensis]MCH5454751.1 SagB/ThcOx family dehydrogenase [Bacillus toyonensis]PFY16404.1 dehydrogenase [Bacillus toyonensis]HDR7471133.1 SagB/ThcOx family dehydrogenase [Bacillus toyonensis]
MQQMLKKSIEKKFGDDLYFWSPSVRWEKKDSEVQIEMFSYVDIALEIFPKFYYITQKGIRIENLMNEFSDVNPDKLLGFIKDLVANKILVNTLLSPQELYFSQSNLFSNPYSQDTFIDPEKYQEFKDEQLSRSFQNVTNVSIKLVDAEFPEVITQRKTYRSFDMKNKVPFETISKLISVFKQYQTEGKVRYNYATAGGLYPIDLFIYIKDHRVENIKAGLYYYNPIENSLQLVSDMCVITDETHYFVNKEIYNSSAFSIFLVYNGNVTLPKYGGMGYFYAAIDSGIMVQLLTQVAEMNNIGLCSVGDINFRKIKKYFKLSSNHVLIHSIEVGLKPKQL